MGEQSNTDTNHPTLFSSGVAALVAVLVLALAAPAAAGDNRGSAEEAQDMVARAIAYYDEMGAEAAVARFNADPAPEFLDRDLYIFVIGPEGTVVAHGVDSSLLGVALASFIDADGKKFGEEIGLMASAEGLGSTTSGRTRSAGRSSRSQAGSWRMTAISSARESTGRKPVPVTLTLAFSS